MPTRISAGLDDDPCFLTFITMITIDCKITNVTEFWKINHFIGHKAIRICDRACENRACGLKYTMSFDETYLNIEM